VRPLRLGEEKKEGRKKPQGKNIMSASAMQNGHKKHTEDDSRAIATKIDHQGKFYKMTESVEESNISKHLLQQKMCQ